MGIAASKLHGNSRVASTFVDLDTTMHAPVTRIKGTFVACRSARVRFFEAFIAFALMSVSFFADVSAQTLRVSVDTTKLKPEARAALGTWHRYLASKHAQYSSDANADSSLWLQSERKKWPTYDLAAGYLLDGSSADVIRIEPANATSVDTFRITTKFSNTDSDNPALSWWREVTETVFAIRVDGQWRLSNALLRNTAGWKRDTVRAIEFVAKPGRQLNRASAERAAAFVDSLADIFAVPRIEHMSYFLFDTIDEAYAMIGLESPVKYGAVAGMAQPINRLLFSGIPAAGEEFRHELAHMVFLPLMGSGTSTFISEGVPTFFGGTSETDYATAAKGLAAWMREHPQVTLDSLMRSNYPPPQTYAAGAVVADVVNEVGGRHGLKLLFDIGINPSEMREGIQRITKFQWSRFVEEWNLRVADFAKKEH